MKITIIVVSYNTKETTLRCLQNLDVSLAGFIGGAQIVVVDNASSDGSHDALSGWTATNAAYDYRRNTENFGFSKGNNIGLGIASGEFVLFLNSDVMINAAEKPDWGLLIEKMEKSRQVGALTVSVVLPNSEIDPASHRGFPTPLRSMFYFMGFEKLLQKFKVKNPKILDFFGGYHLLKLDANAEHEIDACTAAFMLCRGDVLKKLGGFDEDFFMYGEDLDLSYRMNLLGYKTLWYPKYSVTHLKYQSGLSSQSRATKLQIKRAFYEAMWLFYKKHYASKYGLIVTLVVKKGITLLAYVKAGIRMKL